MRNHPLIQHHYPMSKHPHLASRLRAARLTANLKQSDLAERAGCCVTAICHWETGRREPNAVNLVALCGALGVTTDSILLP